MRTDEDFYDKSGPGETSGSTGLAACVIGGKLYIANAGDCRAVLSRKGRRSICPSIKNRVQWVRWNASRTRAVCGGWVRERVARRLASVRGLAHRGSQRTWGQSWTCDRRSRDEKTRLTEDDEFLILACDGLWDVFSSQNAVDVARASLRQHNDPTITAKELAAEALRRDSSDNISVVCVCLTLKRRKRRHSFALLRACCARSRSKQCLSYQKP